MPIAPITLDFETKGIQARPQYPPVPVGLAVWEPGKKPFYLAWGHEGGGNNTTKGAAAKVLRTAYRGKRPLLFFKADFDLDVAEEHFGLRLPPENRWLCGMIESFLYDPNELNLDLKSLADKHLRLPPEERDTVREWLVQRKLVRANLKKKWMEHLWRAPGNVVAPYAIGDVVRTRKLHDFMYSWIIESGMAEAYERERRLMPILLRMERRGFPLDMRGLEQGIEGWESSMEVADRWLRRRLRSRDLNVDSNPDLADALEKAGKVNEWIMTKPSKTYPEGQRSVAMDALLEVVEDKELVSVLRYRASMGHALKNNVRPWLDAGSETGHLHAMWNQVRQAGSSGRFGARTGRLSSSPNAQNIARCPVVICYSQAEAKVALAANMLNDKKNGPPLLLPKSLQGKLVELPWMRNYVAAGRGRVLIDRDYAQQELRILAHFMGGAVLEIYKKDPTIDFHKMATDGLNRMLHSSYHRSLVKQIVLAIIYARGVAALAAQLGISEDEARKLKKAIRKLFPGVEDLEDEMRRRAAACEPIRTWGGRIYYCEEPRWIEGRFQTWEYKLPNTLIQGSAADNTKEAMIRFDAVAEESEMVLQVHDELVADSPKKAARREMKLMRDAMESVKFDVPMYTDGEWGPTWGTLKGFKETRRAA